MVLGYGIAVVFLMGATGLGRTGDHGGPEPGKTVCMPVVEQKKVTTKTFSSKTVEFCQTPIRGLFGGEPQCGPVRTKRVLVLSTKTHEESTTKYIPVVPCAQPACPPIGVGQSATGTAPMPPGTAPMPPGQFPQ
jgi:hypothetical protein